MIGRFCTVIHKGYSEIATSGCFKNRFLHRCIDALILHFRVETSDHSDLICDIPHHQIDYSGLALLYCKELNISKYISSGHS